jgi:hypothetical protein
MKIPITNLYPTMVWAVGHLGWDGKEDDGVVHELLPECASPPPWSNTSHAHTRPLPSVSALR